MSIGRLELARQRFEIHRTANWKLLLTGGYGPHFNPTDRPHAHYARDWLCQRGFAPADFVDCALSGNTIEDALQAIPVVERIAVAELEIVTSDFHLPRAELVFRAAFPTLRLSFFGAPYLASLPREERERRLAHEAAAVARLEAGALNQRLPDRRR